MTTELITPLLAGLLSGLALIIAIGAQNAFVLRQGLARDHVGLVVAICALSDVVLILAGTVGVGVFVAEHPWLLRVLTLGGVAYLVWFGVRSLLSARKPQSLSADGASAGRGSIALTALALTWLNPHVYLDTVLMLGNLSTSHGPTGRWWFALGACLGSLSWFTFLGYAARIASAWFAQPRTWQVLDVLIGIVMLVLAFALAQSAW